MSLLQRPQSSDNGITTVKQNVSVIPDLVIKGLLSAISAHYFKCSVLRSSLYSVYDWWSSRASTNPQLI
ncbi:uncharacterized protein BJ212DRAFT_1486932 [Suillus subaureus]|uniref:Uncharacterized protein n=1 Tax=Suillus subaureus TaxID=48587 RepID=A0A9P7DVL9_9AGAM|nr:uncharacterized protein BJ212DRAFT_1486932 [Suillus subaureus]KAG1803975.1 hypothetical protein BJ212DRAFT_1486932 [Suillus subaureus]